MGRLPLALEDSRGPDAMRKVAHKVPDDIARIVLGAEDERRLAAP